MKVKRILLEVKSLDRMVEEFKDTWKKAIKGERLSEAPETICFDSVEEMHRLLSPERVRLLRVVHEKRPESISELARMLKRDRKNVTDDVRMLEEVGLIERRTEKGKREKVELVVDYDRIQMEIAV